MSQLIGKTLLGGTFVQDPNPLFLKIDGIVLGESSQFGYTTINGSNISDILNTCIADSNSVAIVYNWTGGVAYIKSGFDITNSADYATNSDFTTFVVTSRVTANNLSGAVGTPLPLPGNARVNEFVRVTNGNFTLNGYRFIPVGMNSFCLGLMQETMAYPSNAQITEIFEAARAMKATVIRSHTLGFSAQSDITILDRNNNINTRAFDPIDWAYVEAKRCGIKLIIILCDPYEYYHGSLNTFCAPYGVAKDKFFVSPAARTAFKKYINQYLSHVNKYNGIAIKDNIAVACLELGNELGNIRPGAGSTAIPTDDWIKDISTYIKSLTKILVLNGSDECLGGSTSKDFSVSSVDVYSQHFYWNNSSEMNSCSSSAAKLGKPYIIGEYSSKFDNSWFAEIESNKNIKGSCVWSIYPHSNGTQNGNRINHDDGFTFWFDKKDNSNTSILLRLSNHFRRMQSLPTINYF